MLYKNIFYFPSLLLILFTSCRSQRHIYSPPAISNPFIKEKNDAQFVFLYSGGDGNNGVGDRQKNEGIDIHAGYAITDHLAVMGNYYSRKEIDIYGPDYFDSSAVYYKRKLTDVALGYFIPLDKTKSSVFSVYAGYGRGTIRADDSGNDQTPVTYTRFHEAVLNKIYLQPGFNFFPSDNFMLGIALRTNWLHYSNIKTNYITDELEYFFLDKINSNSVLAFEPSISIQSGLPSLPWLKIYVQAGFTGGWRYRYPPPRAINGSIGLSLDFRKTKKTK